MKKNLGGPLALTDPMRFFKKLQSITGKILAANKIEDIMLDLSVDICDLFGCDRLTLYVVSEGKTKIESKVKTGLRSFKDFSLPISEKSIAGYVALTKKYLNLADVYDEAELKRHSPGLRFQSKVDKNTGYRTRQMLAAPLMHETGGELLGVVQLINNLSGEVFSPVMEDGLKDLCEILATVLARHLTQNLVFRNKYQPLVTAGILSASELELAQSAAILKQTDVETILIDQFNVPLREIGQSLSTFYEVPYETFKPGRFDLIEPPKNFKRNYVEHHRWMLLGEERNNLIVLAVDPARVKASRVVHHLYPQSNLIFHVTSNLEFKKTVDQCFGVAEPLETNAGLPPRLDREATHSEIDDALRARVEKIIGDALAQSATDLRITLRQENQRSVRGLRADGTLESLRGTVAVDFFACIPDRTVK